MSSMLNLQFDNLCKRYRRRNILVNLDISLRQNNPVEDYGRARETGSGNH
jgi:hypothetical protein